MKGVKERTSDVVKKSKKNNVKIKKKECKYNCEWIQNPRSNIQKESFHFNIIGDTCYRSLQGI